MSPSTRGRLLVTTAVLLSALGVAGTGAAVAADGSLETVNGTVRVHAVDTATVDGTADLDAGTNVSVRLQSAADTEPAFIRSETVAVGDGGEFSATFDVAALAPGDAFSVTVVHDGTTVAEADGRVVADDVPVTTTPGATETVGPGFGVASALAAAAVGVGALGRRAR